MTIKIKICGLTSIDEVNKIEKLNVNHIGFINIERSKRYIDEKEIKKIQENLINKNLSTLVLEPENAYDVIKKIDFTQIFNIQLHSLSNFDIKYIKWSKQYNNFNNINITKVIGLNDYLDNKKINEIKSSTIYADNILFDYIKDGLTGGTNTQIPIETAITASKIVKRENSCTEVTLAGGLNYEYIEKNIDKIKYFDRIDLNSGVENKPGHKNISEIKRIIKLTNV